MATETPPAQTTGTAATLRRRAVRGGFLVLGARLLAQGFQWAVTLLVARLLLPDDYGMMTAGMLFLGLADTLAEAGVGRALVQKQELTADDLAQGFTLNLVLSAALYGCVFVVAGQAAAYVQRADFTQFLQVLALLLLLVPFRAVSSALLERDLSLGKTSAVHLGGALVQALLVFAFAWHGWGYWALAIGAMVGRLLETLSLGYAAGWRPRLAPLGGAAAGLLRFGIHVSGGTLLWFIYSHTDSAIVVGMLGAEVLGYYSMALQLMSLPVQKLTTAANQVMYPVYCRLQTDRPRLRDWFLRLAVLQSFVAMPLLAGMALVAADGLPLLLGARWRPAVLPLQILCPVGALMVISCAVPPLLNALGRPDVNLRYTALCTVVYPIAFMAAAWTHGIVGVCLVWLVLYPLMAAGLIHCTRSLTGVNVIDVVRAHLPVLAGVGIMAACVLGAQQALASAPATTRLGASIASGILSYTAFMLLAGRHSVLADCVNVWRELRSRRQEAAA
jgi:teichuronic acid exporter